MTTGRLLTEQEAAELLNLSRRTLEAWRRRGKGPRFTKLGKLVRYRLQDVEQFITRNLNHGSRTA